MLLPIIIGLVNCSLSEGFVPDGFKKAIVTPLIKNSSLPPNELKNYKPVSGLGFISKLVEGVVASQLNDHVSLNGSVSVWQGSVLGPILFSLYTTPVSKVIQNHPAISFHFYAAYEY